MYSPVPTECACKATAVLHPPSRTHIANLGILRSGEQGCRPRGSAGFSRTDDGSCTLIDPCHGHVHAVTSPSRTSISQFENPPSCEQSHDANHVVHFLRDPSHSRTLHICVDAVLPSPNAHIPKFGIPPSGERNPVRIAQHGLNCVSTVLLSRLSLPRPRARQSLPESRDSRFQRARASAWTRTSNTGCRV